MIKIIFTAICGFLLSCCFAVTDVWASSNPSFDSAMTSCNGYLTNPGNWQYSYGSSGYFTSPSCSVSGSAVWVMASMSAAGLKVHPDWTGVGPGLTFQISYSFTGTVPPSYYCQAGQVVPAGTTVSYSSASGEQCSGTCETAFAVGGSFSGSTVLTGNSCSATNGVTKSLTPASETSNADGSKTYCDPISGKCVTSVAAPATAPASSSSSANDSTASTSQTSNPATSSSSTTTTTTTGTGDGSGSTGSGSGSSTSVSNTTTDNPASTSSTATKCTTGVCDVGNADGNVGTLYTAGTDTPASVYNDFKANVANSPLISAATGFFTVSGLSGTCPTWQIPGNKYWGAAGFSFDFFCNSAFLALLTLAGYLVLAVGAFSAFRIALY